MDAAGDRRGALNDDEIRKRVRTRLAEGTLPSQIHVAAQPPGQPTRESFTVGSALSDPCAACGEGVTQFRYNIPTGAVAFHKRCHDVWKDEADKFIRRG